MERSLSRCLVFDLGGVLAGLEGSRPALAAALGVTTDQLGASYWTHRDAYDLGGDAVDFWGALVADLARAGHQPLPVAPDELDRMDAEAWSVLAPDVEGLVAEVVASGTPAAVLSNAPASLARTVRAAAWSGQFTDLLFSSDVGVMKPDPRIYRLVEQRTSCEPADLVFFDDRPVNVAAARRCGWQAHVWSGPGSARRVLDEAGLLAEVSRA